MKKISSILIILMLFNFIFSNLVCAALIDDNSEITYSEEEFNQLVDSGTATIDGETLEVSETYSSSASIIGTETSSVASVFLAITLPLRIIANDGGLYYTDSSYSAANVGWFSVNSLVFGEYLLFNADINQTNKSLNPDIPETTVSSTIDSIKEFVATWFQILSYFSIAFIIVLLIFTALRLAVADIAEDRARYKKVIKAWFIGLLFIGCLPYIISFINVLHDYLMDILWKARVGLENAKYASFESKLFLECINGTANTGGLKSAAYFIEFLAFAIVDWLFALRYFKRSFIIFINIVFAPIKGLMHIFSVIRGGNGCIGDWISTYVINIFIQPLHALLYLVFMIVASNIAVSAPLLAILFLMFLLRAEKIFYIILDLNYGKISSIFSK